MYDNFKALKDIDFNPSRNLGYSSIFLDRKDVPVCEDCLKQCLSLYRIDPSDTEDDKIVCQEVLNTEYAEFALREGYATCDNCEKRIYGDYYEELEGDYE